MTSRWPGRRPTALTQDVVAVMLEEVKALEAVTAALGRVTVDGAGLESLLSAVRDAFGFDYGSAWAPADHSDELQLVAQSGSLGELAAMSPSYRITGGTGLCGRAWRSGKVVDVPDFQGYEPDCPRGEVAARGGARRGPRRDPAHTPPTSGHLPPRRCLYVVRTAFLRGVIHP